MKRKIAAALSAVLLVGMLAAPASAGNHPATEHCDAHRSMPKVEVPEDWDFDEDGPYIETISTTDQNDVAHDLKVTIDGDTVTFELLTDGYTLVSTDLCIKSATNAWPDLTTTPTGQDISYVVVYGIVTEQDPDGDLGEWCSPGYWRQPHHLDSWEATGFETTDLYSVVIGTVTRSKKGTTDGASTDPTLLEVLQNPQWYGGAMFNAVGDLLSDAHPDVDFELGDERVEDSCPLS